MRADRLALLGPPGSGKSTIAAAWLAMREKIDRHDGRSLSFASQIREEAASFLAPHVPDDAYHGSAKNWLLKQFDDPRTKDRWRGLLQWWGTDFRRFDDAGYWADSIGERISSFTRAGDPATIRSIVVDDCRFPNDYSLLEW